MAQSACTRRGASELRGLLLGHDRPQIQVRRAICPCFCYLAVWTATGCMFAVQCGRGPCGLTRSLIVFLCGVQCVPGGGGDADELPKDCDRGLHRQDDEPGPCCAGGSTERPPRSCRRRQAGEISTTRSINGCTCDEGYTQVRLSTFLDNGAIDRHPPLDGGSEFLFAYCRS